MKVNSGTPILPALVCAALLAGCETTSQSSSSSSSANTPATASSASSSSTSTARDSSSVPAGSTTPDNSTSQSGGSPAAGDAGANEVLSREESVAVLDEELDGSIAVFDGMIARERDAVKDAGDDDSDPADSEDGGLFDEPLFEEGDLSEGGDEPLPQQAGTVPEAPNSGSASAGSRSTNTGADGQDGETTLAGGAVPADIPSGSDDDIVARQIREAAMKEKDPALREKLWDEYRKYKAGQ